MLICHKRRSVAAWGALVFLLSPFFAFSQSRLVRFSQVGIDDGLSQSTVTCILQDHKGFMWFGTKDGLNKYDGYRFTVYKKNFKNDNCLRSNDIKAILEDKEGKIWIATWEGGVNVLDPGTEQFTHFRSDSTTGSIATNNIRCLCEDGAGNIWLGTEGAGVDVYNRRSGRFRHLVHHPQDPSSLGDNTVNTLFQDSRGNIWIGTDNGGLDLFDPKNGGIRHFRNDPGNPRSLSNNDIQFIFEDRKGNLWIGTYGGGLNLFDYRTSTFRSFKSSSGGDSGPLRDRLLSVTEGEGGILWIGTENGGLEAFDPQTAQATDYIHEDADNASLTSNTVNTVCRDTKGDIWAGTLNGGIDMINRDASQFAHYKYLGTSNTLINNIINCLYEDISGGLWVGTDGGGISRFDRTRKTFKRYVHERGNLRSIGGDYVLSACEDASHRMWIGTWGDGLSVLDPKTNAFKQYTYNPSDDHSLSSNYAFALLRDHRGRMWIGTYGGGLDLYDPATGSFTRYTSNSSDPGSISNNYILTLYEDKQGRLWIGTDGGGLDLFDDVSHTFRVYRHSDAAGSLCNNSIRTIWEDASGYLWLGCNFGLDRFDPSSGASTAFYSQNGLPDDWVTSILGDARGYLWISTTKGLSRFDPTTARFRNFTPSDGLQGYEFKSGCLCRNGQMYFGGKNGFNEFFPDSIRSIAFDPPIYFTDFQIFNKKVEVAHGPDDASPLKTGISQVSRITLSHTQSVITFEFASLNYTGKEKKAYAYMLEGFDKGWHDLGTKNSVTYTNMDPGEYILRVKGLTNDGRWSDRQASIRLILLPPFWKTWWFSTFAALAVATLILLLFYNRVASIKRQNRHLEQEVAKRTKELKEANRTKDRFFSILAHDLKNPVAALSGISGLLKKKWLELDKPAMYDYIDTMHKASTSIGDLLTNLLDWARTQTQHISYLPKPVSAYELVRKNRSLLEPQLKDKHISFDMEVSHAHTLWADPQMLDTVLRNILANSIKFTPAHGKIRVVSEDRGTDIALTISDNGIGMTPEQLTSVYAMDHQKSSSGTAGEKGTGLGLIVSREFMEINRGAIDVQSESGKGSDFTILCPKAIGFSAEVQPEDIVPAGEEPLLPLDKAGDLKGKRLLLVDDNEEIRNYLKLLLTDIFEIAEAADGAEGINIAREFQPAAIISDMLMPVMNGLEFCQRIKAEKATSHIPVILLTSQNSEESQLSGYEAGADVYLVKDISRHILIQVILNIIRNQEKARLRFEQSEELYPDGLEMNLLDKEFLQDVIGFIEAHLSDPDLDYRVLCTHTAMSRTVLYTKFKTLTGQGVHDFIKTIRIKKGLQLLQEGKLNVTQIAYEIGFATPSYFSKSFTRQYGVPPKEYMARLREKPNSGPQN